MLRFSGIFRPGRVMEMPKIHIKDYSLTTDSADDFRLPVLKQKIG